MTAGSDQKIGTTDDAVAFGTYLQSEHDDVEANAVDWLVLDIQDNEAILVTARAGTAYNLR